MLPGSSSSSRKPVLVTKVVKRVKKSPNPTTACASTKSSTPRSSSSQRTIETKKISSAPAWRVKEKVTRKRQTPDQRFSSSADSSDTDSLEQHTKKIRNDTSIETDIKRCVRNVQSFDKSLEQNSTIIHAADIPLLDTSTKYRSSIVGMAPDRVIFLQYPSRCQKERYHLISPQSDDHAFDAVKDIIEVMHKVTDFYLPEIQRNAFEHESTGFPQRLNRAFAKQSEGDLRGVIDDWNQAIMTALEDGSIIKTLDTKHELHPLLVERILNQTYSRTVSPRLKLLHQYEAGTDNVYGELMPKFVSMILKKDIRMTSDQVFVDLGSGIGNVVLQAALEIGCESWGCEMMKHYCDVADLQHTEFVARCHLWGLSIGKIHLERGDFLISQRISQILQKADVVLVNNQVFSPQLNEGLTRLFLDLKDGCQIVSLKSFAPEKFSARTVNSLHNILRVEKKRYFSGCVSWAHEGGEYFIATKDSRLLGERMALGNKLDV